MVVVVVTGTRADSHLSEVVYFVEVAGLPHLVLLVLVNEGTIFRGITFYVVGLPGLFNSSRFRISNTNKKRASCRQIPSFSLLINVFEALMKGGRYHAVDPSRKFRRCHRQSRKK